MELVVEKQKTIKTPKQQGFSMPGEWAVQEAVWMIWPYRTDN